MCSATVNKTNYANIPETIAIVVPVYNTEQFLDACIQSIKNQTYKNWECFLVDDGSTDGSAQLISNYEKDDPRFHALHKENGGVSSARNLALKFIYKKKNHFGFVSFLDSDDLIDSTMYEKLVHAIKQDKTDLAVCGYYKFYKNNRKIRGKITKHQIIDKNEFVDIIFSQNRWEKLCGAGGMSCTRLYTTEVISKVFFPENRNIVEDEFFNIQVAEHVKCLSYIPEPLYGYRVRPNSSVRNSKFPLQMLKGRELCLSITKRISSRAYLVTVGAYAHAYVSYFKNSPHPQKQTLLVSLNEIKDAYINHLVSYKIFSSIQLQIKHPIIFKFYIAIRKIFRNILFLRNKKKINQ